MKKEVYGTAATALGQVAGFGLFLPAIDKVWEQNPRNASMQQYHHLRAAQKVYVGMALGIGLLQSFSVDSWFPLFVTVTTAGIVLGFYEYGWRVIG